VLGSQRDIAGTERVFTGEHASSLSRLRLPARPCLQRTCSPIDLCEFGAALPGQVVVLEINAAGVAEFLVRICLEKTSDRMQHQGQSY